MAPTHLTVTSRPRYRKAVDSNQSSTGDTSRISTFQLVANSDITEVPKDFPGTKAISSIRFSEPSDSPTVLPVDIRRRRNSSRLMATSLFMEILSTDLRYHLITEYLDFDSLFALRQTCRQMRDLLTISLIRRLRAEFVKQFLADETQDLCQYRQMCPLRRFGRLWDTFYASVEWYPVERPSTDLRCYGCLQMKPIWCFVERMSSRGTGLAGKLAKDRMCKNCMRRYRDIGGIWWKENWITKGEIVRRIGRFQRWRRWALEGRSLVNPSEEVGICSSCGNGPFELWWGCAGCFDKEEKRRREEDVELLNGIGRKAAGVVEAWRVQREIWRRKRSGRQGKRRNLLPVHFGLTWQGDLKDRKQTLLEWKRSKSTNPAGNSTNIRRAGGSGRTASSSPVWRAADQQPLKKDRREARCCICWIPNCPRRRFMIGLAYERQLHPDLWCEACQKERAEKSRRQDKKNAFASDETSFEGVADLFNEDHIL